MVALRSRRLESLFGAPLDRLLNVSADAEDDGRRRERHVDPGHRSVAQHLAAASLSACQRAVGEHPIQLAGVEMAGGALVSAAHALVISARCPLIPAPQVSGWI